MRKIIYIVLGGLLVVAIGLLLVGTNRHSPNITFVMSPGDATATLDNQQVVHEGKFYVAPGTHIIKAHFEGFVDNEVTFTAKKSGQTVNLVLEPNSPEGYDWLASHPDELKKRQGIGGSTFSSNSQQQLTNNPVIANLPYIERYFRIDYGASKAQPDNPGAVALYITYYAAVGKQQALDWLKQQGYDPSKFEIIYVDQTNG